MEKIYILIRGEYPLYASRKRKHLEEMRANEPDFFGLNAYIIEVPFLDEVDTTIKSQPQNKNTLCQ